MNTENFYKRVRRALGSYEQDREEVNLVLSVLAKQQRVSDNGIRALREIATIFEELHAEREEAIARLRETTEPGTAHEFANIVTIISMLEHILKDNDPATVQKAITALSAGSKELLSAACEEAKDK